MSHLKRLAHHLWHIPGASYVTNHGMLAGQSRLWVSGVAEQAASTPGLNGGNGLQAVRRWLHQQPHSAHNQPCHASSPAMAATGQTTHVSFQASRSIAVAAHMSRGSTAAGQPSLWMQHIRAYASARLKPACLHVRSKSTLAAPRTVESIPTSVAGSAGAAPLILVGGEALAAGLSGGVQRQLAWWMAGTAAWVYTMVVLGGITRLTRSGLSMTDWKFTGERPPMTAPDWEAQFAKYKESPEFRLLHSKMTLDEFKFIFWMEYAHRMWGRMLGLAFAVPCAYFAIRGQITRPLAKRLGLLFFMGGTQGLVGWWMVRSGLQEPQHEWQQPRVSPYRLAAHLVSAFAIFATLTWTALDLITPTPLTRQLAVTGLAKRARGLWLPFAALVAVTAGSGAFVAGMDAGRAYNTWPLMGGQWVPEEYWALWDRGFKWQNFFENTAAVQFDHRTLAATTATSAVALWVWVRRQAPGVLPRRTVLVADFVLAVTAAQFTLGIWTLLECVPAHLGSAHQANALNLFVVVLAGLHTLRPANPSATAALLSRWATPAAMVVVGSVATAVTQYK